MKRTEYRIKIQNSKKLLIDYILFGKPFEEWYEYKYFNQNVTAFISSMRNNFPKSGEKHV